MSKSRWVGFIALYIALLLVQIAYIANANLTPDKLDPINFVVQSVASFLGTTVGMGVGLWLILKPLTLCVAAVRLALCRDAHAAIERGDLAIVARREQHTDRISRELAVEMRCIGISRRRAARWAPPSAPSAPLWCNPRQAGGYVV